MDPPREPPTQQVCLFGTEGSAHSDPPQNLNFAGVDEGAIHTSDPVDQAPDRPWH